MEHGKRKETKTGRLSCEPAALEGQLRQVFDAVDSGLIILDKDLKLQGINDCARGILSLKDEEVIDSPLADVLGEAYSYIDWLIPVVERTGSQRKTSFSVRGQDGEWVYINATLTILSSTDETAWMLLSLNDITDHYSSLLRNAQTEKMAAIGLLAAGIAHEFNNIWASVHGYAELAIQNESFYKDLANVALEQSERASEIVHMLLSFSDLKSKKSNKVNLSESLRVICRLVDLELRNNNIELEVEVTSDPSVLGNQSMLQQVFLNLLLNASQAISSNGKIKISLSEEDDFAVVRVSDDGRGMDAEQLKHLFVPFYTTKGALGGNEDIDGHGLGLTLVYNIIRFHNGDIDVDSELGSGTVITVRIPTATEADDAGHSVPGAEGDFLSRKRILVVEDEIVLQGLLKSIFDVHEVDAVPTAEEALIRLSTTRYDVAFVDLILGSGMDGVQLIDKMRVEYPDVKRIVLTGRPGSRSLQQCQEHVVCTITKPFSVDEIRNALVLAVGES